MSTNERHEGQTLESYTIIALGQDVADLRATLATVTAERDALLSYAHKCEIETERAEQELAEVRGKPSFLYCFDCGKSVSTAFHPVPTDTPDKGLVVRAVIICPECIEKNATEDAQQLAEVRAALEAARKHIAVDASMQECDGTDSCWSCECEKTLERIDTAAPRPAAPTHGGAMSDWRDITTAPRDGTTILAYHPTLQHVLVLWFPDGEGSADNDGADTNWKNDWDKSYLYSEPSHWMPLPAPPGARP